MKIKCLLLAAGRGSRMGNMTCAIPKALVPLVGKSIISWQKEALKSAKLNDFKAIGGYKWESLNKEIPVVCVNHSWKNTNMVYSLLLAADYYKNNNTIVTYSDIVFHPEIIRNILKAEGDIVISFDTLWAELWGKRFRDITIDAETFKQVDNVLEDIGQKVIDPKKVNGQYMGILKITPKGWKKIIKCYKELNIRERETIDMTGFLRHLLEKGIKINTSPADGKWCEVDTISDLRLYEELCQSSFLDNLVWSHDWRS